VIADLILSQLLVDRGLILHLVLYAFFLWSLPAQGLDSNYLSSLLWWLPDRGPDAF
jgi:hypothetical protein